MHAGESPESVWLSSSSPCCPVSGSILLLRADQRISVNRLSFLHRGVFRNPADTGNRCCRVASPLRKADSCSPAAELVASRAALGEEHSDLCGRSCPRRWLGDARLAGWLEMGDSLQSKCGGFRERS